MQGYDKLDRDRPEPHDGLPEEAVLMHYVGPAETADVCARVKPAVLSCGRNGGIGRRRIRWVRWGAATIASAALIALILAIPFEGAKSRSVDGNALPAMGRWSEFESLARLDQRLARIDGSISRIRDDDIWVTTVFESTGPAEASP
ncbi:MAG: hypothetical protein ACYTHJ_08780 [Planctomycetota bacterium]